MNLVYYESPKGNFGDDLNPWLWEKLLGKFDNYNPNIDFIGIGSILDERLNNRNQKVVFGSGVREFMPKIDVKSCDFRFVRGPISSKALNGVPYITDGAYCLALLPQQLNNTPKKYRCSVIPYFEHTDSLNWSKLEKLTGVHYIDVTKPVSEVLFEIASSEKIICGAMHGAIIADVLRVPWVRLRFGRHGQESTLTSELKWADWLRSVDIGEIEPLVINPLVFQHRKVSLFFSKQVQFAETFIRLKNATNFYLSDEKVLNARLEQLSEAIYLLKKDYLRK